MKRTAVACGVLLVVVGALAGCSNPAPAASQPAASGSATSAAPGTPGAASGLPEGLVLGPGTFEMPDLTLGLDALGSYRASLTTSFTGTVDGQPQQWSVTSVMLRSQDPAAAQLTIETTGAGAPEQPGQVTQVNGIAYDTAPEQACGAKVVEGAGPIGNSSEPAATLSGVVGAEAAGTVSVNGVDTEHATFDERALGLSGVATSTGELWFAPDGGYLVKYTLTSKGGPGYFGEGVDGAVSWAYEVTDVNQAVAIAVPDACPAGLIDAPLAPGAVSVVNEPGLLQYQTSASLAEVMAFYKAKAGAQGWKLSDGPLTTKTEGVVGYTSAAGSITIFVRAGDGGTKVFIAQERASG